VTLPPGGEPGLVFLPGRAWLRCRGANWMRNRPGRGARRGIARPATGDYWHFALSSR